MVILGSLIVVSRIFQKILKEVPFKIMLLYCSNYSFPSRRRFCFYKTKNTLNFAMLSQSRSSKPVEVELSLILNFFIFPTQHNFTSYEYSQQCQHKLAVSV